MDARIVRRYEANVGLNADRMNVYDIEIDGKMLKGLLDVSIDDQYEMCIWMSFYDGKGRTFSKHVSLGNPVALACKALIEGTA